MLKEVHYHAHRMDLALAGKAKSTASLWERNYNIITDVAKDEHLIVRGSSEKISYCEDELIAAIMAELAMNYYYCPAEYHFATTNSSAIMKDYAIHYGRLFYKNAKKETREKFKDRGSIRRLCWNVEEGRIASGDLIAPLPGSIFGFAYTPDDIRMEFLPSGYINSTEAISWSEQSKSNLIQIYRRASLRSDVRPAIIEKYHELERGMLQYLKSRSLEASWRAATYELSAENLRTPEGYEIRFIFDLNYGSDDLFVEFTQKHNASSATIAKKKVIYREISNAEQLSMSAKLSVFCIICGISNFQLADALEAPDNIRFGKILEDRNGKMGWMSHKEVLACFRAKSNEHVAVGRKAYCCGKYATAVTHFSAAAAYDKNDGRHAIVLASAYGNLGLPHCELHCSNIGLEILPNCYKAIANRGSTNLTLGDERDALCDFRFANRNDSSLWRDNPYLCLVRRCDESMELGGTMMDNLMRLVHTIERFIIDQWQDDDSDYYNRKMHYSNLCTAFALARGRKFRLMNVDSMLGQGEGIVFRMRLIEQCEDMGIPEAEINNLLQYVGTSSGSTYIGSLDCSDSTSVGRDDMWQRYGTHRGVAHAGCALVFDRKLFPVNSGYASDQLMKYQYRKLLPVAQEECSIHRVTYDPILQRRAVRQIVKDLIAISSDDHADDVVDIVRANLDRVRFLFKKTCFLFEDEARLQVWRNEDPSVRGIVKRNSRGVSYVECPGNILPSAIVLGKDVPRSSSIASRLRKHEIIEENGINIRSL